MKRLTFEGNFCDIAKCEGTPGFTSECPNGFCDQRRVWELLKWYEDAEQEGRLVVLPCKVGDPIYTTHWWKDVKEKCTDSKGNSFYRTVHKNIIKKGRFNPFGPDYEWLGKTVFLTREEAEAALEQEGGEG